MAHTEPGGAAPSPAVRRTRTALDLALDAVPVVVALLLVGSLVLIGVALLGVAHPDLGWSDITMLDAKAWATGHLPYGDPATEFVAQLYTPLFTGIVALLLDVHWWEGWGALVSMVAVVVSLVIVARHSVGIADDRRARAVTAAAVVAFPLFCFTIFPTNGVFEARTDQLAWCLFLAAACRILVDATHLEGGADSSAPPDAPPRSVSGRAVTGLLLALAVLAKQTTLPAATVAVVVAWVLPLSDRRRRQASRTALVPVEAMAAAGVGVAVLGVFQAWSGGFAIDLMFGLARRHGRWFTVGEVIRRDRDLLAVPVVILVVAVLVALVPLVVRASRRPGSTRMVPLLIAGAFVAATVPGTLLAQAKQGGDTNQLVGPVWCATLVLAAALLVSDARRRRMAARVVGVLVVVAGSGFVTTWLEDAGVGQPGLVLDRDWSEVPADLLAANEGGQLVLDYEYPSYSITESRSATPGGFIASDLAAAGYAPRYFVQTLLDGDYTRVRLFPEVFDGYAGGYGQRDDSFFWKVNEIIRAGYDRAGVTRSSPSDPGVTFYAPGPRLHDLAWMAKCFGPYRAGALSLEPRTGGGRWCVESGRLRLDAGPDPTSELVLRTKERAGFEIALGATGGSSTLTSSGGAQAVVAGDGTTTEVSCPGQDPRRTGVPVVVRLDPGRSGVTCTARGDVVTVRVGADGEVTLVATVASAPVLEQFTSGGDRVRARLHDPRPGDFG